MRPTARIASRIGLVGGIAVAAAALALAPAQAASADLNYTCDFNNFDGIPDQGPATASFDTAIAANAVVKVGDPVTLNPFTGSVMLPDALTALLRDNSVASVQGNPEITSVAFVLDPDGNGPTSVALDISATPVPASGPMTLTFTGDAPEVTPLTPGTHTLLADNLTLLLTTTEQGPIIGVGCFLGDDNPDTSIDSFEATAASPTPTTTSTPTATSTPTTTSTPTATSTPTTTATPTVTPTVTTTPTASVTANPTTSPVRPAVVQTDFSGDSRTALPLMLGGVLLVGGGAVAAGRAHVRAGSRRH